MNIHFTDKKIFDKLKNSSLINIEIGSTMYGTNDENSDTDILYVYIPSKEDDISFTSTHHQFQYKENNTDHIFIDIFNFIRNTLNGDSTINFEIINHTDLIYTPLSFLYDMRKDFHNYKILRAYLGFCRRDIKFLNKGGTTERDKNKKLGHILRGLEFTKSILNKDFSPIITKKLKDEIFKYRNFDFKQRTEQSNILEEEVSTLRSHINFLLDSNNLGLPTYMLIENQKKLNNHIKNLTNSDIWKEKKMDSLGLLDLIYNVNENDIEY